ncbi:Asp23/Gls24 family envelope stress response protein [Mogibacterium neglectum]|uniref:Asp23/Gls24 family envelope stress response protein n=1 Tax=Mogibacterium neglectum TaxID=114528 RepID=UPI00272B06EE|nr:Asp23/Gls24 family envelope stress response protein [Mogibacterium neglectum]WLD75517.1 Asp23/Gls24 family envelope stress response protein [Mogibacterium neglectum]
MSNFNTSNGNITIDDQVIVGYITDEIHKIKGVSKMISSISDSFSKNIFGRDSGMNGVRISRNGDNISINLHIIVYYGYNIPQLSYEIQSAVKTAIEEFTGLKVDAVNISVEGIDQEND